MEDEDGDALSADNASDIVFKIGDDIPTVDISSPVVLQVDEDALLAGNTDTGQTGENDFGGSKTANVNLTTVFDVGADADGTFQFTSDALTVLDGLGLKSETVSITHALSGGDTVITGSAGATPIYTITLTEAGLLSVELLAQIDHGDNPDDTETNLSINLGGIIELEDEDGDALSADNASDIVFKIGDDIPTVDISSPVVLQVDEDALLAGNTDTGQTGENDFGGSKTANVNLTTVFDVGADADGTFQFTSDALTVLDGLGLKSETVSITHALSGGDTVITGSAGATPIYTITLTEAGLLSVELLAQIDHGDNPDDTETNLSINLGGIIELEDEDGDALSADNASDIVFKIGDDIPISGAPQTLVLSNSFGNSGTADLDFTIGADEPGSFELTEAMTAGGGQTALVDEAPVYGKVKGGSAEILTSNGTDLEWNDNGDGTWSAITVGTALVVFTVSVNSDGTYTIDMSGTNPLDGAFSETTFDFAAGISGGNSAQEIFFDVPLANNADPNVQPAGATIMLVATGVKVDGITPGTVNSSVQGLGVSGGNRIDVAAGSASVTTIADGNGTTINEVQKLTVVAT